MQLLIEGKTDKGLVRSNNEDNLYLDQSTGLFIIADGMGGHASGEIASKIAVDVIKDYFNNTKDGQPPIVGQYREDYTETTNAIGSAVRLANMAIYEAAKRDSKLRGMGTTVVAVLLKENRLSIAHVGDSRMYLVRAGDIEQLTDDHSVVYEQFKRELITKEEADTSDMKNILTRAVGIAHDVEVDFNELTLTDGDILILCSDGLSSMVSDQDILSVVVSAMNPGEACGKLIDRANENGGKDNITVIVGYIRKKRSWLSLILFNFMEWFRR